jgi:hypothetical protein
MVRKTPLMAIWDNPGCKAEFSRALPAVKAFAEEVRHLKRQELDELANEILSKEPVIGWKLEFIRAEIKYRRELRALFLSEVLLVQDAVS